MILPEILKKTFPDATEEQLQQLEADMKENKIFTASEENMDTRYTKLKTDFDALTGQHSEATALIEKLKKNGKGDGDLQGKSTTYETKVADWEKELAQTKLDNELKVALLEEKALDVDSLTYKIKEKHPDLAFGDDGKIKGLDDVRSAVKIPFPAQFDVVGGKGKVKNVDEKKPPDGANDGKTEPIKKEFKHVSPGPNWSVLFLCEFSCESVFAYLLGVMHLRHFSGKNKAKTVQKTAIFKHNA